MDARPRLPYLLRDATMLLFADDSSVAFWAGIGSIALSVATAIGSAYVVLRKDKREERKDTIGEWSRLVEDLRKELGEVKLELHNTRNTDNLRILDLYGKHTKCEAENALIHQENEELKKEYDELKAENVQMRAEIRRMDQQVKALIGDKQ